MAASREIPGYITGTWQIDPVHSHVGFLVKHMMVSKVHGRFSGFSGTIVTAEDPVASTVGVSVDVATIDTDNDTRDAHIRTADFFDAENHPTMTFASTGVRFEEDGAFVDGDLTIRGTTKPVTLAVEEFAFGPGPGGGSKAGFSAGTEINRNDFGVSFNGPIPGGGVALGSKVRIVLEVEADLVVPDGKGEAASDADTAADAG